MLTKLKYWILQKCFKDEINEIAIECEAKYKREYDALKKRIERKLKETSALIDAAKSILEDENQQIMAFDTNKMDEDVVVAKREWGDDLWFLLYGASYKAETTHPRIMTTCHKDMVEKTTSIHIDDIEELDGDIKIGNGSILMKEFIKYCKETDVKYITGELSRRDADHFDRLEHFYKKHGFEVEFNEQRTEGTIRLDLKEKERACHS